MRRYPAYKESDAEFIKAFPSHWQMKRLKHVTESIKNGTTAPQILSGQTDCPVTRIETISTGEINFDKVGHVNYWDGIETYRLRLGDILLSHINSLAILGNCAMLENSACLYHGMNLLRIRPNNLIDDRFLLYWLKSYPTNQLIKSFAKFAIGQVSISITNLKEIPISYPPLIEQHQIADFLDRKTGQIDELIGIKERRIELLQEQRTALINQAVTKGLDPNVEMTPSGVEWIGETPAHWEIIRLRYLGVLQNGISKDSDSFGLGYPFLSYGDVYNNETLPTQVEGLVKSTKVDRERYSVQERDVFFTRTSETIKEIGISSACMKTIENCVFSGFLIRFRNTSTALTKEFSKYYFPSHLPRIFLAREVNIVTRSSLSQELLKRLPVLLPPPDEQKEITMFLDEQTQKIDSMIKKENKQIELLKEYRQSLISEAVTGKIDVRSEV